MNLWEDQITKLLEVLLELRRWKDRTSCGECIICYHWKTLPINQKDMVKPWVAKQQMSTILCIIVL